MLDLNVEEIKKLFLSGESLCSIAKKFNTTHKTIAQRLDKMGVPRNKKCYTAPRKDITNEYIISLFKNGKSLEEVCRITKSNKHFIWKRLQGIFLLREFRTSHNNEFFSIFTINSSYWAGFMAADGYICNNSVGIEIKDLEHIEKFKMMVNTKNKIYKRVRGRFVFYMLRFTSKQISQDLYKNFNVCPKKIFSAASTDWYP